MRTCLAIIVSLTFAACHREPPTKNYPVRGVVVRVDVPGKLVSINAEKIPDWMDAMTMDYAVHDPAQLNGLAPGVHLTATVHVKEDLSFWIDNVTPLH